MLINHFIHSRRQELHLTLQNIADFVGVGKGTVQKWESGQIKDMRRSNIAQLAKILNVSPALLLKDEITEIIPYNQDNSLTEQESKHLKNYRKLNDNNKKEIDGIIKLKLDNQKSTNKATQNAAG